MRIAIVSQPVDGVLPPRQGSIGLWSYHVARRLAADHEVTVYVPQVSGPRPAPPRDGVDYRFVRTAPDRIYRGLDGLVGRFVGPRRSVYSRSLYHLEYIRRVVSDLVGLRPDVVHVHNFTQYLPPLRARLAEASLVLHMNCDWLTLVDHDLLRPGLEVADAIVSSSRHLTEGAVRRFPELAPKCETIFNGVDVELFSPPAEPRRHDAKLILAVGRVSPEKGLHVLVEAFARVSREHPDARLRLVGPKGVLPPNMLVGASGDPMVQSLGRFYGSDYAAELRRLVPPAARDRFEWIDFVPQAELPRHYAEADVLVASPFLEAFGIPVAEAAATALPAVVTRVGGLPEVVAEGRTGLIVEPNDPEALSRALSRMLGDDELRRRYGEAGRARAVDLFSWDRIAARTTALYDSTLKSRSSRP